MGAGESSMLRSESGFFITGGSLSPDAPSYVERQADQELYEGLRQGEFCYVLTSRQMGKSSLMVRTATHLREEGIAVAILDLTAIGQNLSPEQWYLGLLGCLGEQVGLEDELEDYWFAHPHLGPMQRWMRALREVVLPRLNDEGGETKDQSAPPGTFSPSSRISHPSRLVIFVDEIDAVRSLPFSTDEFFAAVRECYNRRTHDPEYRRLTFCLLGVASPSDLIRDPRTTPFNIGRRIELTDFTGREAAPLIAGLVVGPVGQLGRPPGRARALLRRILYWTSGHPYLTQRLCQAVADEPGPQSAAGVDRVCTELFFSRKARAAEDNLAFVRDRLLKTEADRASLLDLYGRVLRRQKVADEEGSAVLNVLRLSGIVRSQLGRLRVRNRIYQQVFDRDWVLRHMPDAELRRQRAAYRRGLVRAAAVSGVVLLVMGALSLYAWDRATVARESERRGRSYQYAAEMSLALREWAGGDAGRAAELLERQRPGKGQADLRGFEWRYLWQLLHSDRRTLRGHTSLVRAVQFSPDGKRLLTASDDGTIRLWDADTGQEEAVLARDPRGPVYLCACFSPDARTIAAGDLEGKITLWDSTGRRRPSWQAHHSRNPNDVEHPVWAVAFSPDGRVLASGGCDGTAGLWDSRTGRPIGRLPGHQDHVKAIAFSPDSRILVTADNDTRVKLWDWRSHRLLRDLPSHGEVDCMAFSPGGDLLATGDRWGLVRFWSARDWKELRPLRAHPFEVSGIAFSRDGRVFATSSWDQTVKLWDVASRRLLTTLRGHTDLVNGVALSPDGQTVASGSNDRTVKLWDVSARPNPVVFHQEPDCASLVLSCDGQTLILASLSHRAVQIRDLRDERERPPLQVTRSGPLRDLALSPDGRVLALAHDAPNGVTLYDLASRRTLATLEMGETSPYALAFSPGGESIAVGSRKDRPDVSDVQIWDVGSRKRVASFSTAPGIWLRSLAFSPRDGKTLAVAGGDPGWVGLWDPTTGRKLAWRQAQPNGLMALAFSPDGNMIATASWNRTVAFWDGMSLKELARLHAHRDMLRSLAFSPDGKTLATGSDDRTVRLWNLDTLQEIVTVKDPTGGVRGLAFSRDGTRLAAAWVDGTVRVWTAATLEESDDPVY
jgi:WD40 repeat protein